jgi:hypothetical protein
MRPHAALVVLALAAAPATAEVVVRVSGGQVDLTATAAPLSEVLDRLARQTGMKVVYEGPAPRPLVTLSLHGRTLTETILSVFEGLGVNFALVSDPAGARVLTLVVAGTATSSSSPSSGVGSRPASPAPGHRPFSPPPGASPDTPDPTLDDADEEPTGDEEPFPGLPPGAEAGEPSGAPTMAPDPALANPAAQPPATPPGAGVPPQPMPGFSSSPFMPQPQPFPSPPPAVAPAPAGSPPAEEGATPASPPPP